MISINELASKIDNTILKPGIEANVYYNFIKQSAGKDFNSICIPPVFVRDAMKLISSKDKIATVIGFPFGYNCVETKVFEAEKAINDGATFIDVVLNISLLKNCTTNKTSIPLIEKELSSIRKATSGKELRIIIETCYLNEEQISLIVNLIIKTGCDVVKTSTGFGTCGADENGIRFLKSLTENKIKIKASGGIV